MTDRVSNNDHDHGLLRIKMIKSYHERYYIQFFALIQPQFTLQNQSIIYNFYSKMSISEVIDCGLQLPAMRQTF